MRHGLKRALSGAAALGLGATLAPMFAGAASAAPGPQPSPTITPSPVPTATTNFSFSQAGGVYCDNSGAAGWRVHSFIVNDGVDVSTLDFTGATSGLPGYIGADFDATDGTIAAPLHKGVEAGIDIVPASSPLGLVDPALLGGFNFDPATGWNLVDGTYQIGFVCVNGPAAIQQSWTQTVTIDADASSGTFMSVGTAASAPTIDSATPDSGQITIEFTGTGADNWTAQASTVSGDFSSPVGTSTTATSDADSITISGLTNGASYFVRVLANKAGFPATPSTQAGPVVIEQNCGTVQSLAVMDSGTDDGAGNTFVDVEWDAPAPVAGCPTPTGYTVAVNTAGTPNQPAPGGDATSARVTGVPTNVAITVTVTPIFATGFTGTLANVPAFVATGNIVVQDIDVTRPIGALVLTQVCGVNGALPAEGVGAAATFGDADGGASNTPGTRDDQVLSNAPLGFDRPGALGAIPAAGSSTVNAPSLPSGGEPSLVVDPAGGTAHDQTDVDPAYAAYPYPTDGNGVASPASETHCGLDLGIAEFVTQGSGAGQYFAADAAINQVSIVDTRNVDQGWTVTGAMEDFVASSEADDGTGTGALDSFSGDFLGWTPVVTEDTSAFDNDADAGTPNYDQQVVAGTVVGPNTIDGLGDGATLATAAAGEGLGTAILDARIKLLIPVTADAGLYEGSLRFSAV